MVVKGKWISITIVVGLMIFPLWLGYTLASPESNKLVLSGHGDLTAGRYQEALKKFTAASWIDANDAEAVYFEGATLNRMGRFQEALTRFEKAHGMGFKGLALAFDTGWAMLRLGRWNDALVQLEFFEKLVPGRGKTSEFIGQALMGLKDYPGAEAKLKEAIQRDGNLKPTALLHLAMLELQRDNSTAAKQHIDTLLREAPESSMAQVLKRQAALRPLTEKK